MFHEFLPSNEKQNTFKPNHFKEDVWKGFKNSFTKGMTLELKKEEGMRRYEPCRPISEMTLEEFKDLLIKDGEWNAAITATSYEELTIEELKNRKVIQSCSNGNEYISEDFIYGENGFERLDIEWKDLRPYHHTEKPPKDFTIDIIVHSRPGMPGVFDTETHASIRMTTPGGEIYSLGFYPAHTETDLNLKLRKGSLRMPDEFQFMPSKSFEQHVMTYTLPDPKKFHELVKWIEDSQRNPAKEGSGTDLFPILYHPTHHNCSFFAEAVRDKLIEFGAKSQGLAQRKITNLTRAGIRVKQFILKILTTNPLGSWISKWGKSIEYAGMKQYTIKHIKGHKLYLPIDLLLDYQKTAQKMDALIKYR